MANRNKTNGDQATCRGCGGQGITCRLCFEVDAHECMPEPCPLCADPMDDPRNWTAEMLGDAGIDMDAF